MNRWFVSKLRIKSNQLLEIFTNLQLCIFIILVCFIAFTTFIIAYINCFINIEENKIFLKITD